MTHAHTQDGYKVFCITMVTDSTQHDQLTNIKIIHNVIMDTVGGLNQFLFSPFSKLPRGASHDVT